MEVSKYKYWFIIPILAVLIGVSVYFIVRVSLRADGHPKLIIDHDGGADDAMAIFMALLHEQYFSGSKVFALTTTHGNVYEPQSFINSQRILQIAERSEVPIYRGSNSSLVIDVPIDYYWGQDGLGGNNHDEIKSIKAQPEHAALGIIELTKQYPGEITLVALGPLTNIALALRIDPTFVSRLSHLYIAAGHVYSEDHASPEFNALQDVEAYHVAVQNANPEKVTIIPYSQVMTSTITRDWRMNVLGVIPTKIMKAQNEFETKTIDLHSTWSLLDPVAMGAVLNATIVGEIKYSKNSIILCGDERGVNTNNFTTMDESNVEVFNDIREEEYKDLLISIFSAELTR